MEKDFERAMQAHNASVLHLRIDIAVTVAAAAIGAYYWLFEDSPRFGMALVGIASLFALMLVAAFIVIPRVVFRRETKFRGEYTLTFSEEGIHFQTTHINSKLEWNIYSRALVDCHSFILYYGVRSFSVIPKRVFQSSNQQSAFEQLLSQKIPTVVMRD